jgi:hypothetical protein
MNALVITTEPVSAEQVTAALGRCDDPGSTQVLVIAPALHDSPLKFWLSDADEAIEQAEHVRRATLASLDKGGVPAAADTGDSDPAHAIEDALATYPAEKIVIFSHGGDDQRYREEVDSQELEERFGMPVRVIHVPA